MSKSTYTSVYTREDISTHNNEKSLWVIIENNVYDLTGFLENHPGGQAPLLKYAGKDATTVFNSIQAHKNIPTMASFLESMCIGEVLK